MASFTINGIIIEWLGHDGFRIKGDGRVIYIDPYKVNPVDLTNDADIILITHEHYDHCHVESIKKIYNPNTQIVATPGCISKLSKLNIKVISANESLAIDGLNVRAVPAYNTNKPFHPKTLGVGYIITLGGVAIYHAGDTDNIPEMADLALDQIDVALLPVSGTYVMTAKEAADAVMRIKPKVAIPMHYGSDVIGTREDAEKFKELVGDAAKVEILG